VTQADLYQVMRNHKLAVLGSLSHEGLPQSALIGIAVTPQLEVIFDTLNSSRKYRNLVTNNACSLVIGWDGEQTVQYEGTAEELKPPGLEAYRAIYFQAHPDGPSRLDWPGIAYFLIRPRWIRYSDFNETPALIGEFSF
jgi:pyridoxine/pyridoxamine 5'-phosphate oxidase